MRSISRSRIEQGPLPDACKDCEEFAIVSDLIRCELFHGLQVEVFHLKEAVECVRADRKMIVAVCAARVRSSYRWLGGCRAFPPRMPVKHLAAAGDD